MPQIETSDNDPIIQKFGGGVHTRASEEEIQDRESADGGQNYRLDPRNRELRPRQPFDLLATVPDGSKITGAVNLIKSDGTSQIAVSTESGNVYEYDNGSFGSAIATGLNVNSKLRGRIEHNWAIDDIVLITDISGNENLYEWDGTSSGFVEVSHNLTGNLKAKYCFISGERVWLGSVNSNGTNTPHAVIASEVDDYTNLSTTKATSATGSADPFWLLMPDLKPINGMVEAYGRKVFSTKDGQIFDLAGSEPADYAINDFYPRSGASGDESLVFTGDDIMYGRRGRIESLKATDRFGDVSSDDLSQQISDAVDTYTDWTNVYNSRTQQVLCIAKDQSLAWNFSKPVKEQTELSPWVKYTTNHAMGFNPSFAMNMIDPNDGLEYIFMGDNDGNFYRLEGTLGGGDGGTTKLKTTFIGMLRTLPTSGNMSRFNGYIRYRKDQAYNVDLTFQYAGRKANDTTIQINVAAEEAGSYYGQDIYYAGDNYYGANFSGRILEKYIGQTGQGESIQIKVEIETEADFKINEIGFLHQSNLT